VLAAFIVALLLMPSDTSAGQPPSAADTPVFVAYYWRAKPGKAAEYEDYIKNTAEAIDESARRAGVFEEVRTVTPAAGTVTDWTHLRIFRLKNADSHAYDLVEDWIRNAVRERGILFEWGGSFGFRGHRFEVVRPGEGSEPFLRVALGRRSGWSCDRIIELIGELSAGDQFPM